MLEYEDGFLDLEARGALLWRAGEERRGPRAAPHSIGCVVSELLDELDRFYSHTGGSSNLDYALGRPHLTVAYDDGGGASRAFVDALVFDLAVRQGVPVLAVVGLGGRAQFVRRLLAARSGVPTHKLWRPDVDGWDPLVDAVGALRGAPIFVAEEAYLTAPGLIGAFRAAPMFPRLIVTSVKALNGPTSEACARAARHLVVPILVAIPRCSDLLGGWARWVDFAVAVTEESSSLLLEIDDLSRTVSAHLGVFPPATKPSGHNI